MATDYGLFCRKSLVATRYSWLLAYDGMAAIRNLALATRNVTTPLTVEYLTPANDASGRLYVTQIQALIYGSTHKEVDLTGAHCTLIRAMTGSVTLPPSRRRLRVIWAGDHMLHLSCRSMR